jgi:hypothetical protein
MHRRMPAGDEEIAPKLRQMQCEALLLRTCRRAAPLIGHR